MELRKIGAGKRDSLQLDLLVELDEGFGVAPDGAPVVGDLGSVLVLNNTQLERVGLVRADVVGGGACVRLLAMRGVWSVSGWVWQVELVLIGKYFCYRFKLSCDLFYSVLVMKLYFGKTNHMRLHL